METFDRETECFVIRYRIKGKRHLLALAIDCHTPEEAESSVESLRREGATDIETSMEIR